jgi:hypothetical protein
MSSENFKHSQESSDVGSRGWVGRPILWIQWESIVLKNRSF